MKLNPDCTRAILMAVEDTCDYNHMFRYSCHNNLNEKFSSDEIKYHARQCDLAGFFYKYSDEIDDDWSVIDLSPKGHEFLANIRSDTVWNNVKDISTKVGGQSPCLP